MSTIQWNLNSEENYQFGTVNVNGTSIAVKDAEGEDKKQVKNGSVYMGDSNLAGNNSVADIKEKAQKRALKKLVDQMVNDLKNDDVMESYAETGKQATEDMLTRQQQVQDLQDGKERMMESYNMTEDDIDRTNSRIVMKSLTRPEDLTAGEKEVLAEMPESLKDILTCEAMQTIHQQEIDRDMGTREAVGKAIEDFKVELLKEHPMIDAQKEADGIMEEAGQTILGMLRQEGMDKINDDIKENEEIQEKKEEEKKEEEKRTEGNSAQQEASGLEDSVKEMRDITIEHAKVQREVKKLMNEELLIDDDLKGLNLDEML